MIGILILTHGGTARELLHAAQVIAGPLSNFDALSLDWSDCFEEAKPKIKNALRLLDQGEGVLILTDMFGGTPSNVAMSFHDPGRVEILSGVNLPMVLRLACNPSRNGGVAELGHWLQDKGRKSMCLASDMVHNTSCENSCLAVPEGRHD
ncbi:MAG: PTS sugar transporter subunit IIA [Acidobacteriota bacterium]|nr:PTS sugar transporter subunit IIA [Acidobacteriota bacterium]